MQGGPSRWLLLGNSRWHWAADQQGQRHYWSEAPASAVQAQPLAWAAVGPVPEGLDPARRVGLGQIPLQDLPPWLGVDRALGGYEAWCRAAAPVLVADAGTAFSLTWIDAQGRFAGGRLMAGAALQLRALHHGTLALPVVEPGVGGWTAAQAGSWPRHTTAAMASGVLEGMAGALQRAARQLAPQQPGLQLWLTGGDGASLAPLLEPSAGEPTAARWRLAPGLCLDGLARAASLS